MAERLKHFQPPEGVVFVGKAQEKTPVFRTEKRRNPQTGDRCAWIVKSTALVNHYYFTRVHPRLLRPGLSEARSNAPPLDSALQRCFQQLEAELQRRVERAEIAASKLDSNATSLRNQGFQWFDGMLYNPPLGVPHPDTMEKLNLERTLKTMNRTCMPLLLVLLAVTAVQGLAQAPQQPQRVVSPEVQPDRRATFRFRAPNAKEVFGDRAVFAGGLRGVRRAGEI
jgi:hypothetical protein